MTECKNTNPDNGMSHDEYWNEGFRFAIRGCGWQEGEDPATEGLYIVRDSQGNVEVGLWYARSSNGTAAHWTAEWHDLDRDDIVAWMRVPEYTPNYLISRDPQSNQPT